MEAGPRDRFIDVSVSVFCAVLIGLLLYFLLTFGLQRTQYGILFFGVGMVISTLAILHEGSYFKLKGKWLDGVAFILIAISLVTAIYFFKEYMPINMVRRGMWTDLDFIMAALVFIPLLLLVRKEGGFTFLFLVLFFIFYCLYGNLFPGIFFHSGFSFRKFLQVAVLGFSGIYGMVLGLIATWVVIFLLFSGLMRGFGALDVLTKVLYRLLGGKWYLIPQVPVVASMMFGSFSGSPIANIAGTGAFTIPLLKSFGIPRKVAGAIEAVASSGGMIMPPVMGAVAFLMCEFLGIKYLHLVIIAFIPALLYYLVTAIGVYWRTKPYMQRAITTEKGDEGMALSWRDWGRVVPMVIGITVLFTYLVLLIPLTRAVLYGIGAFLAAQIVYELFDIRGRSKWGAAREFARNLLTGVRFCAQPAAMLAVIGGCLGIIIQALAVTGLGPKLSYYMVDISGGSVLLMVLLTLALAMIFGMAGGGIITYVLLVFVMTKPFADVGIEPLTTHFMLLYLCVAAQLTPPVAASALIAASVAGAPFLSTAWESCKLGAVLFIMPVTFIVHPELLNVSAQTASTIPLLIAGYLGMAYCLLTQDRGWQIVVKRVIILIAASLALFHPAAAFNIPSALVVVVLLGGRPLLRMVGVFLAKWGPTRMW